MRETSSVEATQIRLASIMSLVVGLWLVAVNFVVWSPVEVAGPWNHGITGLAVVVMAGYRLLRPLVSSAMSWIIAVLGVWLMVSPFLFGYSLLPNILWGDIAGGLLLVVSGVWGGLAGGRRREV